MADAFPKDRVDELIQQAQQSVQAPTPTAPAPAPASFAPPASGDRIDELIRQAQQTAAPAFTSARPQTQQQPRMQSPLPAEPNSLEAIFEKAGQDLEARARKLIQPGAGGVVEEAAQKGQLFEDAIAEREAYDKQGVSPTLIPATLQHAQTPTLESAELLDQAYRRGVLGKKQWVQVWQKTHDKFPSTQSMAKLEEAFDDGLLLKPAYDLALREYQRVRDEELDSEKTPPPLAAAGHALGVVGSFFGDGLEKFASGLGYPQSVGQGAEIGAVQGMTDVLQTGEVTGKTLGQGAAEGALAETKRRAGNYYTAMEDKQAGELVQSMKEYFTEIRMKEARSRGAPMSRREAELMAATDLGAVFNPIGVAVGALIHKAEGTNASEDFLRTNADVGMAVQAALIEIRQDPLFGLTSLVKALAKVPALARSLQKTERYIRGGYSTAPVVNVTPEAIRTARQAGTRGAEIEQGVVVDYNIAAGRGHVRPVGGGEDILIHADDLGGLKPQKGDALSFRRYTGPETTIASDARKLDADGMNVALDDLQQAVVAGERTGIRAVRGSADASDSSLLEGGKRLFERAKLAPGRWSGNLIAAVDYNADVKRILSMAEAPSTEIDGALAKAGYVTATGVADRSAFRAALGAGDARALAVDPRIAQEVADPTSNTNIAGAMIAAQQRKRGLHNMTLGLIKRAKKSSDPQAQQESIAESLVETLHEQDEAYRAVRPTELNEQFKRDKVRRGWYEDYQEAVAKGDTSAARNALGRRLGLLPAERYLEGALVRATEYVANRGMAQYLMDNRVAQTLDIGGDLAKLRQSAEEARGARQQAHLFQHEATQAGEIKREQRAAAGQAQQNIKGRLAQSTAAVKEEAAVGRDLAAQSTEQLRARQAAELGTLKSSYDDAIRSVRHETDLEVQSLRAEMQQRIAAATPAQRADIRDEYQSAIQQLQDGARREVEDLEGELYLAREQLVGRHGGDVQLAGNERRSIGIDAQREMSALKDAAHEESGQTRLFHQERMEGAPEFGAVPADEAIMNARIAMDMAQQLKRETQGAPKRLFRDARHALIGNGWRRLQNFKGAKGVDQELLDALEVEATHRTQRLVDEMFPDVGPALRARLTKQIKPEVFVNGQMLTQFANTKRLVGGDSKVIEALNKTQNVIKGLMVSHTGFLPNMLSEDTIIKGFTTSANPLKYHERLADADAVLWAGVNATGGPQTFAGGLSKIATWGRTPDVRKQTVRIGNRDVPVLELNKRLAEYGVIGHGMGARAGQENTPTGRALTFIQNAATMGLATVTPQLDDLNRAASAIDELVRIGKFDHESLTAAAAKSGAVYFNYDEVTPVMRLANIIPFVQYTAKTSAFAVKQTATNPGIVHQTVKPFVDGREPAEEPTYRRQQTGLQTTFRDEQGLDHTFFWRVASPYEVGAAMMANPVEFWLDQFGTPLIEAGIKAADPRVEGALALQGMILSLPAARGEHALYTAIEEGRQNWPTMTPTEKAKLLTEVTRRLSPAQVAAWSPDLERYYNALETVKLVNELHRRIGVGVKVQREATRQQEAKKPLVEEAMLETYTQPPNAVTPPGL